MKRTLKRILPILLGIVVICSIIWYLFIYDRDFTQDLLLRQARFFDSRGNYTLASQLYDLAYRQSGNDDSVAIELAEQYKAAGNYTKAEYTLSNAIADGGSVELYIALCKTYVEQDKLLDAVTMLDNITDETVKAQLTALRPAAPTADPMPGSYIQYLPVTVSSEGGTLYLTTDKEYPSIQNGSSENTVTLVKGENTIYALCVADSGLVSPLSILGYYVGGVVEDVTLKSEALDSIVRSQLGLDPDAVLTSEQLWSITSLTLPEGLEDYSDLSWFTHLEFLTVCNSTAEDLSVLSSLTQLKEIHLTNCTVSSQDLLSIASLPALEKLTLSGCGLSGISNLSGASGLTYLNLSDNSIRDLSPLSFMTGLTHLDISHNALSSVNALSSLTNLVYLDISYNSLTSIIPLTSCTELTTLNISNNSISSLSGAENLTKLSVLKAGYNALNDVSSLSHCPELRELNLENNALTDISMLSSLVKLQILNFSQNEVSALPVWRTNCELVSIDGSYNQITTISTLSGYENLNYVIMESNQISSVEALANCYNLIKVNVYNNPVSDVSILLKMSVIVVYTP